MSFRRARMRAMDARTGRLERAIDLVEDGETGSRVHKREADQPHPLSRPFIVQPDRAQVLQGLRSTPVYEGANYTYQLGYTAPDLYRRDALPVLVLSGSAGSLTYVYTSPYFGLEDGSSRFLLEDGVTYLIVE